MADTNSTLERIDGRLAAGDTRSFNAFLKQNRPAIEKMAAGGLTAERITNVVMNCVLKTPALQECSMASILRSVLQAVQLGLEPGGPLGEAYLVPFNNRRAGGKECQLVVGYRGFINLAFRSGIVKSVAANVVYKDDFFEYEEGFEPKLRHKPNLDGDMKDADITHAYATIHTVQGGVIYRVMSRKQLDAVKAASPSGRFGPWVDHFAEMCAKTPLRRAMKRAPMSVEMTRAWVLDAEQSGEIMMTDSQVFDLPEELQDNPAEALPETKTSRAKALVQGGQETEPYNGPTVKDDKGGLDL